jgi:DNA-binding NarL/FixJ family response regulator
VRAILRRDCTDKDLLGAIEEARAGRLFLDARVSSGMLGYLMSPRAGVDSTMRRLSDRELQILELLADGVTPGGIGLRLQLAPRTVSAHLAKMQRKLEVESTQALIVYAVRWRCGKGEAANRGPETLELGRERRVA